jgi:hypothetical protein
MADQAQGIDDPPGSSAPAPKIAQSPGISTHEPHPGLPNEHQSVIQSGFPSDLEIGSDVSSPSGLEEKQA